MWARLIAAGLLLALLAAACGSDDSSDSAVEPTDAVTMEQSAPGTETAPAGPGAPTVSASVAGQPASLAPAGGCWREDGLVVCGDPPAPSCSDATIPHLAAGDDGVIALSIGATPKTLTVVWEDGTEEPLPEGGSIAWRPAKIGLALLQVDLGARGSGAFALCVDPS
ncbi:MAG: hypothetical protein OEM67_12105 [Thermoleophilia bacterium]|nr:hypothetical protein [Thermoleophilia bacterium]MDH3725055.1 hypothetical protein [Thermoleophilia bacterium]